MRYSCSLSIYTIIRYNCEVPFNLVAMDKTNFHFTISSAAFKYDRHLRLYSHSTLHISPIPASIRGVGAGEIKDQLLCLLHFLGQNVDRKMLNF